MQNRERALNPDHARADTARVDETPAQPAADATLPMAFVEPAPDPLAGLAVNANELLGRIHAGQGEDLTALIRRTIAERTAA